MISQRITFLFVTCFVFMCSSVLGFPGNTIYDTRYSDHIDAKWFLEQTLDHNLLKWFNEGQAVLDNGFIISTFERDWIPRQPLQASITSQGRSIYALAVTYELTGDIKYKEMLIKAADFLQSAFKDPDYEGYVYSVDSEGNIVSDVKYSYGHAFVVWGFTHAYRITKDIKYLRNALYAIKVLEVDFTDEYGGFVWRYDRTFTTVSGTKSFNNLMHYIEALLYLYQETNLPSIRQYLSDSLNFMADKYNKEYGYIPENFDNDWNELTEGRKAVINIGHQFQWAFFLQMAVELGFPKKYFRMGETALDFAMKYGYDEVTGAVITKFLNYSDFSRRDDVFWWCQTEALRTFAVYAEKYDREEMWEYFDRSLQYAKDHFIDHVYGGWYVFPDVEDIKIDNYHITTMNREILRISGMSLLPVDLSGTIKTADGTDICAMVLASGKFTFSCNPPGMFSLTDLPSENDGTVKRQLYADGFFPEVDTLTESSVDAVVMTRSSTCPNYNTPYNPAIVPRSAGKRIDIFGTVLMQSSQTPICAMVLANGQYTFSCDGSGSYALNIPLDTNGQFKLQVYAQGFAPMIQSFDEFQAINDVRMAGATECQLFM